jgi:hypothetical protein
MKYRGIRMVQTCGFSGGDKKCTHNFNKRLRNILFEDIRRWEDKSDVGVHHPPSYLYHMEVG